MQLDPKVATIESYLDRNFASSLIRSVASPAPADGNAHTFTIEDDGHRHVLAVCRDFLDSYRGSMWEYLQRHDVAETLRRMGSTRVVVTPEGLRTRCADVVPSVVVPEAADEGARPTPLTEGEKQRFLGYLQRYTNVSWAAEQIGKTRACMYAHRKRDARFARAWDEIKESSTGRYNRVSMKRGYRVVDLRTGAVRRREVEPRAANATE